MKVDQTIKPTDLAKPLANFFNVAGEKILKLDREWNPADGSPVFTKAGKYTSQGWTEWTQGFQFGLQAYQFDATGDTQFHKLAVDNTRKLMAAHVSHIGVHDHGFNNLSTYGNLRRLMLEGKTPHDQWELEYYELAIKLSGAVQGSRWSPIHDGLGYVYSFNGPHSLFVDTMRTIRIMCLSHKLGHVLMGENDLKISLLNRAVLHALATYKYITFHGDTKHTYDVRGRTAHEAVFNRNDARFRCRSSQQGYSPFSTWTRGLAWAMLGFAELYEFIDALDAKSVDAELKKIDQTREGVLKILRNGAEETCDHYINQCAALDGIVYWDDGAPNLHKLGDWQSKPADPYNDHEPVDASASAIAAQGLLRLGKISGGRRGKAYTAAGLTVSARLLEEPYLSTDKKHHGLLLHSVYHRPNNWDYIPKGKKIPLGESSMWGDYHLMELAVYLKRLAENGTYLTYFG